MNVEALSKYMAAQTGKRQQFGSHDCVTFVVGALMAGWDRDYSAELRYSDRRSAVRRLRQAGGLRAACTAIFGDMRRPGELVPGDIAYFEVPATLGVVMPGYVAVLIASQVQRIGRQVAVGGWRT